MTQLQPLLGLDKSSPLIEVLIDPSYPDEALVHFGTRLLEKVHLGKDSVEAKLLAGRLYNAGFKRKTLTDEFKWDLKTIRGYGDALKSGSAEALARALAGQGAPRKVDDVVDLFIRQTFRDVYKEKGCHSNAFIRKELERKQNVTVSRETVRLVIKDELNKILQEESAEVDTDDQSDTSAGESRPGATIGENGCDSKHVSCSELPKNCKLSPSTHEPAPTLPIASNADKDQRQSMLLHHGGLLLVRALIDNATTDIGPMREMIRQWIAAVLCGCVNIEQMGSLNYPSLEVIIGPQLNAISAQREMLLQNASEEVIAAIRRNNLTFLNVAQGCPAFLYDPHGIEYTGQLKLLKGWLGGSHQIGKAYYQDFIHTLDGKPMVAFLDDNRSTLLKRLPANIEELRSLLGFSETRPVAFTVDRAIYRVQENNMGYLINHNGINEITSYQNYTYEQAAAKLDLDDYLTDNPELRRLSTKKLKCRQKKARLHIRIEDRLNFYKHDQQTKTSELAETERQIESMSIGEAATKLKKRRASLRRSLKTLPDRRQDFLDKTNKEIKNLDERIQTITDQCLIEPKKVQRIEYLISREYDRLNFAPKALMDAVRLLAHNIHRHLHDEFRPIYDNYRNDHRILRELIQSPAFLKETSDEYLLTLIPSRLHGKIAVSIMELIDRIPPIETANGKPLRIELQAPLKGIQFAI